MSALGSQSFTDRITATSFSQPYIQVGTLASPTVFSAVIAIPYQSNINKYVLYVQSQATAVPITQVLEITGVPSNFLGVNTITSSTVWSCNGPAPVITSVGVFSSSIAVLNNSAIPNISAVFVDCFSTTAPTFTSGSPILKLVVNFNLD